MITITDQQRAAIAPLARDSEIGVYFALPLVRAARAAGIAVPRGDTTWQAAQLRAALGMPPSTFGAQCAAFWDARAKGG